MLSCNSIGKEFRYSKPYLFKLIRTKDSSNNGKLDYNRNTSFFLEDFSIFFLFEAILTNLKEFQTFYLHITLERLLMYLSFTRKAQKHGLSEQWVKTNQQRRKLNHIKYLS